MMIKTFPLRTLFTGICISAVLLAGCSQVAPPGENRPAATADPQASPTSPGQSQAAPATPFRPATAETTPPAATPTPGDYHGFDPEDLQGIQIAFWYPLASAQTDLYADLAAEFSAQNEWGIEVQPVSFADLDTLEAAYLAALEPGEGAPMALPDLAPPDLALAMPHQLQSWNSSQPLTELDGLMADPQWGLSEAEQGAFAAAFWKAPPAGEARLSAPAQRTARFLAYNQSWARELGFDRPPASADELRTQACAGARANLQDDFVENDGTGGLSISTNYAFMLGWIYAFGGDPLPAGQPGYQLNTPEVEQAFRFLRGLLDEGCAHLDERLAGEAAFASRQALFAPASTATLAFLSRTMEQAGSRDAWTIIPFSGAQTQAVLTFGPDYAIPAAEPEQRLAAWLFTRWLLAPAQDARLAAAGDFLPVTQPALDEVSAGRSPAWQAAVQLLESAHPEPTGASWGVVRWALGDAGTQLFRYYFTIDQTPELLELLEETAADLAR